MVRTIPSSGRIIYPKDDARLEEVLAMGCWSELGWSRRALATCQWSARMLAADGSHFEVLHHGKPVGDVNWQQQGMHNVANALVTIAAARHVGVVSGLSCEALNDFSGVKRRMELLGEVAGVKVYDDFAHHPTAIATTLEGLRARVGTETIRAIIEPRSNTMKMGYHRQTLTQSTAAASEALWFAPEEIDWLAESIQGSPVPAKVMTSTAGIIDHLLACAKSDEHWVIMSNGGFEKIHTRLLEALKQREQNCA